MVGTVVDADEPAGVGPETVQPSHQPIAPCTETRVRTDVVADLLVQRGYHDAITYSFIDPKLQEVFAPALPALTLANPISAEMATMRASLWPGLVTALAANQRRQQARVRLFEVGRKFIIDGQGTLEEIPVVAGVAAGPALPEQWGSARTAVEFFDVKTDVEAVLRATGAAQEFRFVPTTHPALPAPTTTQRTCEV